MEFKNEELIEREIEIAGYLLNKMSLNKIEQKTGLKKKILEAHIKNMMKKLKAANMENLVRVLKKWKEQ